ncbi:MAG: hypothetical protein O2930_09480 [Acidobacteria bacterium]|nr:hypothetical protein [Acidobacteriota bacterium]
MTTYALAIVLFLMAAVPASARDVPLADSRWAPWLGGWRLVQNDHASPAADTTSPDDVLVCVRPASAGRGIAMTTFVGGQSVVQQTIVADGTSRPVSEPECSGSQESEWSLNGLRLFTRAEITCGGQPARAVSGITLMTEGPTWVDIQAVGTHRDAQVRVRRYRRTTSPHDDMVLPPDLQTQAEAATARLTDQTSMTFEDAAEASAKIALPAVEAALRETHSRIDLPSHPPSYPYYAYRWYYPYYFHFSPFGYSNWWGDLDSNSPPSIAVAPEEPAQSSGDGPNWWGETYLTNPPQIVVAPQGPARPGGNGPHWWGDTYSSSPDPIVVVPRQPAQPSGGGPNWWGKTHSATPDPIVVAPRQPAQPSNGGPNWWGKTYSTGK